MHDILDGLCVKDTYVPQPKRKQLPRVDTAPSADYSEILHEELARMLEFGETRPPALGPVSLDARTQIMRNARTGDTKHLTSREFQVMWMLIRGKGITVPMQHLENYFFEDIPDDKDLPLSNVIEVAIAGARKKLAALVGTRMSIHNAKGIGYALRSGPDTEQE